MRSTWGKSNSKVKLRVGIFTRLAYLQSSLLAIVDGGGKVAFARFHKRENYPTSSGKEFYDMFLHESRECVFCEIKTTIFFFVKCSIANVNLEYVYDMFGAEDRLRAAIGNNDHSVYQRIVDNEVYLRVCYFKSCTYKIEIY